MSIPFLCGRPIFEVIPHDVDGTRDDEHEAWLFNKAARWTPDLGWTTHLAGNR